MRIFGVQRKTRIIVCGGIPGVAKISHQAAAQIKNQLYISV
jgi:hypothetical protein